jgi:thioredoxin 1
MSHIETNNHLKKEIQLIQFYAEWCQPCRLMMPVVESIKLKQLEWLSVQQIDIDQDPFTANQLHVRSIPTFVILRDNKEVWREVGMLSEYALLKVLKSLQDGQ